jgi:transposase
MGGKRRVGQVRPRPRGGSQEPIPDDRFDDRACPPAGGDGPQKRGADKALGRSRGGRTTKIYLLANELGLPVDFLITGGQINDCTQAIELLGERKAVWVLADKGYDSQAILDHIEAMGAVAVVPSKSNRKQQLTHDKRTLSKAQPYRAMLLTAQALPPIRHTIRKTQTELQRSRRARMLSATPLAICRYSLVLHAGSHGQQHETAPILAQRFAMATPQR